MGAIGIFALLFDTCRASLSALSWFAIFYNIFLAGTRRIGRGMRCTLGADRGSRRWHRSGAVVGVFSGMLLLGERPGMAEWSALALSSPACWRCCGPLGIRI